MDPHPLKTVFVSLTNLMDIQIAKSVLASDGIDSIILNENLSSLAPHYILAIGGVQLVVAEDQSERSREILDDYIRKTDISDRKKMANRANPYRCPSCAGQRISFAWVPVVFPSVVLLFILGYLPYKKEYLMCGDCHTYWDFKA